MIIVYYTVKLEDKCWSMYSTYTGEEQGSQSGIHDVQNPVANEDAEDAKDDQDD